MKDKIKHILELDEKRTQGAWWFKNHELDSYIKIRSKEKSTDSMYHYICETSWYSKASTHNGQMREEAIINANFIAQSPTMIEIIKELQADARVREVEHSAYIKFTQDTIEELQATVESKEKKFQAFKELSNHTCEEQQAKIDEMLEALIWCTGSEDFARDGSGKASIGANKIIYPIIDREIKDGKIHCCKCKQHVSNEGAEYEDYDCHSIICKECSEKE